MTTEIDRIRPTRFGSALGIVTGLVAVMFAFLTSPVAGLLGLLGIAMLLGGFLLPHPRIIGVGAVTILGGVLVGGVLGGAILPVVLGTVFAILAWDFSHNSASQGRQVGHTANTVEAEVVHALGSLTTGLLAAAVAIGLFSAATTGQPATAVALLGIAGLLLVMAIR